MRSPDGSFRTAPSPARWGNAIRLFPGVSEARNMPANSTLSNYAPHPANFPRAAPGGSAPAATKASLRSVVEAGEGPAGAKRAGGHQLPELST